MCNVEGNFILFFRKIKWKLWMFVLIMIFFFCRIFFFRELHKRLLYSCFWRTSCFCLYLVVFNGMISCSEGLVIRSTWIIIMKEFGRLDKNLIKKCFLYLRDPLNTKTTIGFAVEARFYCFESRYTMMNWWKNNSKKISSNAIILNLKILSNT